MSKTKANIYQTLKENGYQVLVRHCRNALVNGQKVSVPTSKHGGSNLSKYFLPTGGITVVKVFGRSADEGAEDKNFKKLLGEDFAICSEKDNFCYKTGREIALIRLVSKLKLKLKPTEE